MTAVEVVLAMASALGAAGVAYMVVGAFSSNVHGVPRSTKDADFVVELSDAAMLNRIMDILGAGFQLDPQLLLETVTGNYRYVITHRQSNFKIELFLLSRDPHHIERFARRQQRTIGSAAQDVWVQTAEDVIIQKLRWFARAKREKDWSDVVDVIATQQNQLDLTYIRRWCAEHATLELFEQAWQQASSEFD